MEDAERVLICKLIFKIIQLNWNFEQGIYTYSYNECFWYTLYDYILHYRNRTLKNEGIVGV